MQCQGPRAPLCPRDEIGIHKRDPTDEPGMPSPAFRHQSPVRQICEKEADSARLSLGPLLLYNHLAGSSNSLHIPWLGL